MTGTLSKRCDRRTDRRTDGNKCSESCLVAAKNMSVRIKQEALFTLNICDTSMNLVPVYGNPVNQLVPLSMISRGDI